MTSTGTVNDEPNQQLPTKLIQEYIYIANKNGRKINRKEGEIVAHLFYTWNKLPVVLHQSK